MFHTGVGRPECNMDPSAYVLQKFNPRERKEVSHSYDLTNVVPNNVSTLFHVNFVIS